jgi:tripartite-type tricarboxylate transporter receptor subunit TctC
MKPARQTPAIWRKPMITLRPSRRACAGLLLMAAAGLSAPVRADPVEDFYRGKEIRLVIGLPAGGGYDIYGRLFARHLSRFVPGHPGVIVQNMPGAGAVAMTNALATQFPRDGTFLGAGVGSIGTAPLFGVPGARYDARQLTWIGSLNAEVGLVVSYKTSAVKTAADLFTKELIVGGSGATDGNVMFPTVMNKILGTKFKVIPGYGSTNTIAMAMEQKEIEGAGSWHYSSISTNKPTWLKDGTLNLLVQLALHPHPAVAASVPVVLDLAKTPEQRSVLELVFAQQDMGRPIYAPPGIPADRAAALRKAFDDMMRDAEFLKDAATLQLEINRPMSGAEIETLVKRLHALPADIVQRAGDAIQTGG